MSQVAGLAALVSEGYGVYTTVKESQEAKAAEKAQKKAQQKALELAEKQAGEYIELTKEQMKMQSQYGTISTLASLIEKTSQPAEPMILTLPQAKEYSAMEQINQAIGKFLGA